MPACSAGERKNYPRRRCIADRHSSRIITAQAPVCNSSAGSALATPAHACDISAACAINLLRIVLHPKLMRSEPARLSSASAHRLIYMRRARRCAPPRRPSPSIRSDAFESSAKITSRSFNSIHHRSLITETWGGKIMPWSPSHAPLRVSRSSAVLELSLQ